MAWLACHMSVHLCSQVGFEQRISNNATDEWYKRL